LAWKAKSIPEKVEVVFGDGDEQHRADIVGRHGVVIELQHSPISPETIRAREVFYRKYSGLVWLFDASDFAQNIELSDKGKYQTFRWKWPRRSLAAIRSSLWFDLGAAGSPGIITPDKSRLWDERNVRCLFEIKKVHNLTPLSPDEEASWLLLQGFQVGEEQSACRGWGYLRPYSHFIRRYIEVPRD